MRYLVLIPSGGQPLEIHYRELESARNLRDGDKVFLDELLMSVQAVLDSNDGEHDAEIVCRPAETP